jgi:hypothetical protein
MEMKESQATADEESGARTKIKQYRKHTCIKTQISSYIVVLLSFPEPPEDIGCGSLGCGSLGRKA